MNTLLFYLLAGDNEACGVHFALQIHRSFISAAYIGGEVESSGEEAV